MDQSLRHDTNPKRIVKKAIGQCSRKEAFSLVVTLLGDKQSGDRAGADVQPRVSGRK